MLRHFHWPNMKFYIIQMDWGIIHARADHAQTLLFALHYYPKRQRTYKLKYTEKKQEVDECEQETVINQPRSNGVNWKRTKVSKGTKKEVKNQTKVGETRVECDRHQTGDVT